jgi:hypothetical protein
VGHESLEPRRIGGDRHPQRLPGRVRVAHRREGGRYGEIIARERQIVQRAEEPQRDRRAHQLFDGLASPRREDPAQLAQIARYAAGQRGVER